MPINRIIGLAVCIAGLVLLGFAWHAVDAPVERASEALTGSYTDRTMWYWVVGTAAAVSGGALALVGRRV